MRKIIFAVTALAVVGALALSATAQSKTNSNDNTNKTKKSYDTACVQTAVAKRDDAIGAALDTNHETLKAALATRTKAMQDAAALTSGRKAAHRTVRDAWKASAKASLKTLKAARDAAWVTYQTELKGCGATSKDDDTNKNIDNVLFNNSSSSSGDTNTNTAQ